MKTRTQVLSLFVVLSFFAVGEVVEVFFTPPQMEGFHTENETYRICIADQTGAIITDIVTELLILTTGVMVFSTRKLMNVTFAQANHLFMSTLLLNILWATVRTAYYLAEEIQRPLLGPMFILLHNFILWSWLVVPVLYIAVFKPQQRFSIRSPSTKFVSVSYPSSHFHRSGDSSDRTRKKVPGVNA